VGKGERKSQHSASLAITLVVWRAEGCSCVRHKTTRMARENGGPQSLGKNICAIVSSGDLDSLDGTCCHELLGEMVCHAYVFVLEAAHRVLR
jgi:hypothetical protein